jgi:hypothetical protein
MKKRLLLLSLLFFIANCARAERYAGEFLEIGVGGRAAAMGGAMTAHVSDGTSFYWNPAGGGYIQGIQVAGMYADLWEGLANYSVAGIALPVTGSVFSINWVRLGVPDIEQHPDYEQLLLLPDFQRYVIRDGDTIYYDTVQEYLMATGGAPEGVFTDAESAIFFSFAKLNQFTLDLGWSYFTLPMEMPIGGSVKLINQSLGDATGTGIGADFGMQFRFPLDEIVHEAWRAKFAWGFNLQDVTRTAVDWGENNKDAIPLNFRSGAALTQKLPGKRSQLTIAYDTEKRWERRRHIGLEYSIENVLSLRGGFWHDEWTAGAGISIWRAQVDYAYYVRDLGTTHRVSFALKLK